MEGINIDNSLSLRIDNENTEYVNIYQNKNLIEQFSLKRRIYTLFKTIQILTKADGAVLFTNKNIPLYGKEIQVKENFFIKFTDAYGEVKLKFYEYDKESKENILYVSPIYFHSQKFFSMLLLPEKIKINPGFLLDPQDFKEIIHLLSLIRI